MPEENNQEQIKEQQSAPAQQKPEVVKKPKIERNDYEQVNYGKPEDPSSRFSGVTVIALGQAGANIGLQLERELRKHMDVVNFVAINSAQSDLDAIKVERDKKFLIPNTAAGAGKKRDYIKKIFYNEANPDKLFNEIVEKNKHTLFGLNKLILVTFSTGGGSGSSIGPKFVAKLTKYCATTTESYVVGHGDNGQPIEGSIDPYRPNIIGVALMPDFKSELDNGIDTLQNTLECLNEIDVVIKNRLGSFVIVQNKIDTNEVIDKNIFSKTNANVVTAFKKFIKCIGVSNSDTILDVKDRFVALSIPGVMCFSTLEDLNKFNMLSPAIGSTVSKVVAELSFETEEERKAKYNKYLTFASQFTIADNTIGWNDINLLQNNNKDNPIYRTDIVLMAGFTNLSHILTPIRDALDRKINALIDKDVEGRAFDNISELKRSREESISKNTNPDINIDELF